MPSLEGPSNKQEEGPAPGWRERFVSSYADADGGVRQPDLFVGDSVPRFDAEAETASRIPDGRTNSQNAE